MYATEQYWQERVRQLQEDVRAAYDQGVQDTLVRIAQEDYVLDEGDPYREVYRRAYRQGRKDAADALKNVPPFVSLNEAMDAARGDVS